MLLRVKHQRKGKVKFISFELFCGFTTAALSTAFYFDSSLSVSWCGEPVHETGFVDLFSLC